MILLYLWVERLIASVQRKGHTWIKTSKLNLKSTPKNKHENEGPRRDISVFKLIRTDTTLDLSQKA